MQLMKGKSLQNLYFECLLFSFSIMFYYEYSLHNTQTILTKLLRLLQIARVLLSINTLRIL